jgi:hypothetical protein
VEVRVSVEDMDGNKDATPPGTPMVGGGGRLVSAGGGEGTWLKVGPGRCCSPRHMMPVYSRNMDANCDR